MANCPSISINPLATKSRFSKIGPLAVQGLPARRMHWFGLTLLSLLLALSNASAGEKIRFTEPEERTEIPDQKIQNILSDPLGFGPKQSDGGSLAPILAPPIPMVNVPKEKEDKKWMFDAHGKVDYDAALKQIFKIRDYDIDRWTTNPDSSFNSLLGPGSASGLDTNSMPGFERNETLNGDRTTLTNGTSLGSQRSETDEGFGTPEAPNPELDLYRLLHPTPSLDPLSKLPSDFNTTPFGAANATSGLRQPLIPQPDHRKRERTEGSTEFQKLIGPNPLLASPLTDLLQNRPESARQESSLVQSPADRSISTQSRIPDAFAAPTAAPRPSFSSTLESFNARANPSSLAPSFIPPADRGISAPRAPAFEIPRRKF